MWLRPDVTVAVAQASNCSSDWRFTSLGTSICHRCGPTKKKKKKKKKERKKEKENIGKEFLSQRKEF